MNELLVALGGLACFMLGFIAGFVFFGYAWWGWETRCRSEILKEMARRKKDERE